MVPIELTSLALNPASKDGSQTLQVIAVPAFKDNYLWLLMRGGEAAVVDPGDAAPVEAALADRGLALRAILLTHHHQDHVGGVRALRQAHPDVTVHGPRTEAITGVTVQVAEGGRVSLGFAGLDFVVMEVPGHTRGHIAYYAASGDASATPLLFCGDTLFAAGCGRLFEGTPAQMHASLSRLASLPGETRVYCAHEYTQSNLRFARVVEPSSPALIAREQDAAAVRARGEPTLPSTIALERATNPFLRGDEPSVRQAAEQHSAGAGASSLATFTALRTWKDSF